MAVVPYKKFKVVETESWDGDGARKRMLAWATEDGKTDWAKYRQGFGIYNPDKPDVLGEYKFPHHDVKDGEMVTDTSGVSAAMGRLESADISEAERAGLRAHLMKHRKEWAMEESLSEMYDRFQAASVVIEERGFLESATEAEQSLFQSRVPGVALDSVYTFALRPSTQAVDSYGTRMSKQALTNYARDAIAGTPFMNSHRTGGGFFVPRPTELPLGYSYHGVLENLEGAVDESPKLKRVAIPMDDDIANLGASLKTVDYVLKDYWPNGQSATGTNDVIRGIEGRAMRSISIGFGSDSPKRLSYVCGLCGGDMTRWPEDDDEEGCRHIPLLKDKKSGLVAFAWVYDSKMYEHSMVWAGATPGAMVAKARMFVREMSREEMDYLESLWRVSLRPERTRFVMDKVIDDDAGAQAGEGEVILVSSSIGSTSSCNSCALESGTPLLEAGGDLADTVSPVLTALDEIRTSQSEQWNATKTALDAIVTRLSALEAAAQPALVAPAGDAALAQDEKTHALLECLYDEAVKARVRALGAKVDEAEYRRQLVGVSVERIRAEIAEYEAAARRLFKPGRATANAQPRMSDVSRQGRQDDPALYQINRK